METKQPLSTNTKPSRKKSKNNIILITCAAILLLGLIGTTSYFAYKSFNPTIVDNGKIIIDPTTEGSEVKDIKTTQEGNKTAMLSSDKYEIEDVKVCIGGTLLAIKDEYTYTFSNSNNKALVTIYKTALDKHKGVITITPKYKSKDPEPTPEKELESISASFKETKSYMVGDSINRSDIKVEANYTDKTSKEILDWTSKLFNDKESYTFSKEGEQEIDISYNNKSTSLKVNVLDRKEYLLSISGLNEVYYKGQSLLVDSPNLVAFRVKSDGTRTKLQAKDLSIDVKTFSETGVQNVKVVDNTTKAEALLVVNVLEDNQVNKVIFENQMKNFASLYGNSQIEICKYEDDKKVGDSYFYKQYAGKEKYDLDDSSLVGEKYKKMSLIKDNGYQYVFPEDKVFSQPSFMNNYISSSSIYNASFVSYELNNLTNFDIYTFDEDTNIYKGNYVDSSDNKFRYEVKFNKGVIESIKRVNESKGEKYYNTYTYSYNVITTDLFTTPTVTKNFNYIKLDVTNHPTDKNYYYLTIKYYEDALFQTEVYEPQGISSVYWNDGNTGVLKNKLNQSVEVDLNELKITGMTITINYCTLDKFGQKDFKKQ